MLWYAQNGAREEVAELPYVWLRSVELVREPNRGLMVRGTLAGILGLLMWFALGFATSILMVGLGVILIFAGAQGREAYYQLRSDRINEKEQARWRIPFQGSMNFIVAVGERSGKPLAEDDRPPS